MSVSGLGFGLVPPSALLSRALSVSYSNQDLPVGLLFSECYAPLFRGVNVNVCVFIPRRQHAYLFIRVVPPPLQTYCEERLQRSYRYTIYSATMSAHPQHHLKSAQIGFIIPHSESN